LGVGSFRRRVSVVSIRVSGRHLNRVNVRPTGASGVAITEIGRWRHHPMALDREGMSLR